MNQTFSVCEACGKSEPIFETEAVKGNLPMGWLVNLRTGTVVCSMKCAMSMAEQQRREELGIAQ